MIDVVVIGSIFMDFVNRVSELPQPGSEVYADSNYLYPGGKGANQAVAVERLGVQSALIGCVGQDDWGDTLLHQLHEEGVETAYIIRSSQSPTGTVLAHVDHADRKQTSIYRGANDDLTSAHVQAAASIIQNARILIVQLGVSMDCIMTAAQIAHEAGVAIFLDPAPPRDLPDQLYSMLTLIKPNAYEASRLTGIEVTDCDSAQQAADRLQARGVETVAIQAGDDGNLLCWGEGETLLPHVPVEVVDTTGSGDTFMAGLAVARIEGRSWDAAGRLASAAAALAARQFGAQQAIPHRQAVEAMMADVYNQSAE